MTERELEILALIKADPLIPQQKLADQLGITRSAVAGHIMNLTHKGVIRGKGYILAENPFAVVIGGANMDILGRPASKLRVGDSNPGSVSCSPGGVGRNIAENLARLGSDTRLVTAVGKDAYGEMITAQCRQAGVDMGNSLQFEDAVTSTYLSVLDGDADMHVAINDMAILERLGPEVLKGLEDMLRRAELLVLDTNLSEAALSYLLSNFPQVPVFIDTVSCVKAMKIKPYLNAIHTLKPNLKEAEHLSGIEMRSKQDLSTIANWFHEQGVKRIFLSMGSEGVFVSDGGESQMVSAKQVEMVNANGAGDAFLAGLAHGWLKQWPLLETTEFAMAAARLALSHIATINPNMSEISVNRIIKESLC
ncbi:winged helix-turn-helix transcriptional regulator [Shewanella algae]|uniref:PfkB family carbohydrate kinase n=1 Tax=Shewanella algae TaxID=38313 RepID=UPI000F4277B9|nr:PfkB family carbohydrate kinase [Shewanella algae]AYV13913.1 winged helix-turn-helix transcriptional regulator [Shewanella algae]MBO2612238.1 winged helix-turn-helix transcriptional regulator [Shewanella algae]MBO2679474.1 winged helix-turn-helix transcriptional regulator [Shewanella algae]